MIVESWYLPVVELYSHGPLVTVQLPFTAPKLAVLDSEPMRFQPDLRGGKSLFGVPLIGTAQAVPALNQYPLPGRRASAATYLLEVELYIQRLPLEPHRLLSVSAEIDVPAGRESMFQPGLRVMVCESAAASDASRNIKMTRAYKVFFNRFA